MIRTAGAAAGTVTHKTRLGFRQRDHILHRIQRGTCRHHQHVVTRGQLRNRFKIAQRVKRQFLIKRRRDGHAARAEQNRVPVGRRFRHHIHADGAARAGAVIDDHGLPPCIAHLLPQHAADDVHAAAGPDVDHHAHGPRGKRRAVLRRRQRGHHHQRHPQRNLLHTVTHKMSHSHPPQYATAETYSPRHRLARSPSPCRTGWSSRA